ncbi:MAG: hypothetical protein AAFY33_00875 [Cyanobacteria bacterium J06643_4]
MKSFLNRFNWLATSAVALFLISTLLFIATVPVRAQAMSPPTRRISPAAISAQIYEQHPDFPLENQYISSETGSEAVSNTLISRIIRYHLYIKNRPTTFRLDWKLTLADYLGAFERISAERYVDYGLQDNPLEGDVAAIESLSLAERDRLANALYESFAATDSPAS